MISIRAEGRSPQDIKLRMGHIFVGGLGVLFKPVFFGLTCKYQKKIEETVLLTVKFLTAHV